MPVLGSKPTKKKLEAYRIMADHILADIESEHATLLARWQEGELDHLYGPYQPKGVVLQPPPKIYVGPLRPHPAPRT
jgi:hypothetical protein